VASTGHRADAVPEAGGPGSDPDLLAKQLFREAGVDLAILLPAGLYGTANPEHDIVLRAATNLWVAETWLGKYNCEGRFRASIHVAVGDPAAAAAEVEKWAGHPGFVQVEIDPYLPDPLGHPKYRPLHEAAARHDLPLALHISGTPGMYRLSPVGFPSYYAEQHPTYAMSAVPHVVSMVTEGVFDRLPNLKLVLVEVGVSWLGPLLWRLDHVLGAYSSEVRLARKPSEYMHDHLRLTTQPLEEPDDLHTFHRFLRWLDAEHTLMFSSDYPHHDYDDPAWVARRIPAEWRSRVFAENARELYNLPQTLGRLH
jgi:predicted TIM-barrel fold metal-dependent hydrolase